MSRFGVHRDRQQRGELQKRCMAFHQQQNTNACVLAQKASAVTRVGSWVACGSSTTCGGLQWGHLK
eukprot:10005679-Alexandrium_andersonii.AAC.1